MQKVVKFLEANVQWVALGLGGLFFLWMVWSYVITPPARVMVAGSEVGPGEVDQKVQDNGASPLDQAANSTEHDVNVPKTPKDNVNDFVATMSNVNAPSAKMEATAFDSRPFIADAGESALPIPDRNPNQNPGPNPNPQIANKISAMPVLPPAEIVGAGGGLSSVQPPANQAIAGAPGAVAVVPVVAGANGQPLPIDKAWATVTFRLPTAEINKSFNAVQVPPGSKTLVLQIEMVRQEMQPDGNWGAETPVRGIAVPGQLPYPPTGTNGLGLASAYRNWAEGHESEILQPQFYNPVLGGTQWLPPGLPMVAQNVTAGVTFDPTNFKGDLSTLTPEQRKAALDARRAKQIELNKNKPKAAPRGGGGKGGPAELGGPQGMLRNSNMAAPGAVAMNGAATPHGAVAPSGNEVYFAPPLGAPQPARNLPPEMQGVDGEGGGGYGGGAAAPPPGLTPEAQAAVQKHPTQSFDPADPNFLGGIICWAHDDNVEAGKTYRYKMHYKLLNPGFTQTSLFVNPKLAVQFDIVSQDSAWTQPVDVPSQTTFYVSRNPLTSGVPLDIFHWQNGQLHFKASTVSIGDMIGGPDGDTDYTSGWTVADIRSDPRGGIYVLMMDNNGKTVRRDFATDSKDPKYAELKNQANAAKGQQPGGSPAPGGTGIFSGGAGAGG